MEKPMWCRSFRRLALVVLTFLSFFVTTGRPAIAEPSLRLNLSSRRMEPRADTGWYRENPLTISATLRCPQGGPDCPFPFTLRIRANQGARFYFLEEDLGSGVPPRSRFSRESEKRCDGRCGSNLRAPPLSRRKRFGDLFARARTLRSTRLG